MKRSDPRPQKDRLPDSFFEVLGTWEDDREPEEILRDIRQEVPQKPLEKSNLPCRGGACPRPGGGKPRPYS
jgi:hypothetical protein